MITLRALQAQWRDAADALRLRLQFEIKHDSAPAIGDYSYLSEDAAPIIAAAFEKQAERLIAEVERLQAENTRQTDVRLVRAAAAGLLKTAVLMLCPERVGVSEEYRAACDVPSLWPCSCGKMHEFSAHDCEILFQREDAGTEALRATVTALEAELRRCHHSECVNTYLDPTERVSR